MHPNTYWSNIYNIQDMEATQMSTSRGMDKDVVCVYMCMYIYIYSGRLLRHKKKWNFAICWDIDDLETVTQSEVKKRKKNIVC